jgi:hypothetical protein
MDGSMIHTTLDIGNQTCHNTFISRIVVSVGKETIETPEVEAMG